MNVTWTGAWYAVASILLAGLTVLNEELLSGQVPIPTGDRWLVPIATAMISASLVLLRAVPAAMAWMAHRPPPAPPTQVVPHG